MLRVAVKNTNVLFAVPKVSEKMTYKLISFKAFIMSFHLYLMCH